ncbi:hypothetical protein HanRHA438_Chr10g0450071 [Helianthus annuus]|nr:hypothetical protein HanHA300_Chr10g0360281 [Helianthus annuus]KAJ0529761.1 hypothetical protein HanHA89_Chr10g0381731 [Helianthus annuus]KAJ0696634.1 hypothetical protein HanLR1_Chr10g0359471 [Helianthus annuus]KAJ0879320.1 hypothetical protein HanRHA438_Chr10g0450071 [Helianthus annuus]KAJ0883552.1 hypothetical protein HanPSC8_Chr10g0422881 [Helianthus annuus]
MTGNRPVALVVLLVFAREGEVGTRCGVKVWIERERGGVDYVCNLFFVDVCVFEFGVRVER